MKKKEFPILEFDNSKDVYIDPSFIKEKNPTVSSHLVICFFKEVLKKLLDKKEIEPFFCITGENVFQVYRHTSLDCIVIHGVVGGPGCGGFLEKLIALGVKKVMFCGGGGALKTDITVGKFVVIESAVRDEGTSYHYLEPSREVESNPIVLNKIVHFLQENQFDYLIGKTWTTDAFYRETKEKVALRKEEECLLVEMEQASLIAIAQFREIEYGAIVYGGDDLTKEKWDSRKWKDRTDIREILYDVFIQIVMKL